MTLRISDVAACLSSAIASSSRSRAVSKVHDRDSLPVHWPLVMWRYALSRSIKSKRKCHAPIGHGYAQTSDHHRHRSPCSFIATSVAGEPNKSVRDVDRGSRTVWCFIDVAPYDLMSSRAAPVGPASTSVSNPTMSGPQR